MSAMIAKAFVAETDEILTPTDRALPSKARVATTAVFDDEIAMAEPAGEMPLVFWP